MWKSMTASKQGLQKPEAQAFASNALRSQKTPRVVAALFAAVEGVLTLL
jgi:hypothetical protein